MSRKENFVEGTYFPLFKNYFLLSQNLFSGYFSYGKPAILAAFFLCLICGHPDSAANKSPFDDLYAWKKHIGSRKIASDHIEG